MCYRRAELDVAHALPAHNTASDLDTTLVTDDTLVADAFVFATVAFVVFLGTEDFLVEQAMLLGALCAVVNGFRFGHLARRPTENLLRRCERQTQAVPSVTRRKFAGSECHNDFEN